MRRFLIRVLSLLGIPLILLAVLYLITDPYKTLRPFSLTYFDQTNRDYLSSELFILNYPDQKYDSFIFGSSRGCGINTYHWKEYLPVGAKPFLFQAWGETLTGIVQKIDYIDKAGLEINNVIILLDIPGTFAKDQSPTEALSIKDPAISGQPYWLHQAILFYDFIQKPSQWMLAVRNFRNSTPPSVGFDIVTNDWDCLNQYRDNSIPPQKDSLKNMSKISKASFLKDVSNKSERDLVVNKPLIHGRFIDQMHHIKEIFDNHGTDYRIVVTPGYCYTSPAISPEDESALKQVFGNERVFDYSGKNSLTSDYNNYSDSGHFGLYVGWHMIEDMYGSSEDVHCFD